MIKRRKRKKKNPQGQRENKIVIACITQEAKDPTGYEAPLS